MSYLIWLLIFVWIPIFTIWFFNFKRLWKYRKTLICASFFALVFSIPWDIFAVTNNIWIFPKEGNIGFFILGLPLEEYLFMVTVTWLLGSIVIMVKYHKKQ